MKGYVPVRRGLLDHLADMNGSELKVYFACLLMAKHTAPNRGTLTTSMRELGNEIGMDAGGVSHALKALEEPHGSRGVKYLKVERGSNQFAPTKITVVKYAVVDLTTADQQQTNSRPTAVQQHDTSDQGKDGSKKIEKGKNVREDVVIEPPAYSELPPCMKQMVKFDGDSKKARTHVMQQAGKLWANISTTNAQGGKFADAITRACIKDCDGSKAQVTECTALILSTMRGEKMDGKSFPACIGLIRTILLEDRRQIDA